MTRACPASLAWIVLLAPGALAAQERGAPDVSPEAAARAHPERADTPPSAASLARAELDAFLAATEQADLAAIGRLPPGAETLEAALADAFEPSLDEAERERAGDPVLAIPRHVFDQLPRQTETPTDQESRDPALPPLHTREDELDQALRDANDPRRARIVTRVVELALELDREGRISAVRMTRSSMNDALDRQARRAVRSLSARSFGAGLALHRIDVRFELCERVLRWSGIAGTFGDAPTQLGVLGRGIAWSRVRIVRVSPPPR